MILLLQNDSDSNDTDDDIWDALLPEPAESTQTQRLAWQPFPPPAYDDPYMVIGLPKKDGTGKQYISGRDTIPHTIEEPLSELMEECSHLFFGSHQHDRTPSSSSSALKQSTNTRFVWDLEHYTEIDLSKMETQNLT